MGKTIIVSNRLPIRLEVKQGDLHYVPSEGGLATGLGSIYKEGDNIWIGWPGKPIADERKEEVVDALAEHNMQPVFLTEKDIEDYYLGFSNETLWPAFHFVQHVKFNAAHWDAYVRANRKFADAILHALDPSDVVWVHDYQLMLVPQMIREVAPEASIGFFQHIPFPSYEVFRMIPWRQQLLNGVLGADYIGFHTYDDTRHFLSSCHRLAGIAYDGNELIVGNRLVIADSLPMGIDYKKYADSAQSPEASERAERYVRSLSAENLVLSIDRLDYSKGIPARLRAFEAFLDQHPRYRGQVSLVLLVVPSRDTVESYKALKEEVDLLVGRINGSYGEMAWTPIHYFYRSFSLPALSALYKMCDIAMITPMRDGMNLVCKEFIASKRDGNGVLILSEMAGSAKELSDALLVNPNDQQSMVDALVDAIEMDKHDRILRMNILQQSLQRYTIFHWVKYFLSNLNKVKQRQADTALANLDDEARVKVFDQYNRSDQRMIFLDYDGTLVGFNDDPNACQPDGELIETLVAFTSDPRNHIIIISGRDKHTLGEWLGNLRLDLIAEHGTWFKSYGGDWVQIERLDAGWKPEAREILSFYVDRTPGSFIEEKDHSLAWHYRKAEMGLGKLRSRELVSQLRHELTMKNLTVLDGNKVVEIKPEQVNKGRAAQRWIAAYEPSFLLAAGDDKTDEDTFKALPKDAVTIKIGPGHSAAEFGVSDHRQLRFFLSSLIAQAELIEN